ncbi:MAG: ankyrin repeat domain-containing protein [Polyangiaceae bacterium]
MTTGGRSAVFASLLDAIASGHSARACALVDADPSLAVASATEDVFDARIGHHVYRGDTALHVAAAAPDVDVVRALLRAGAAVRAKNRRGAEPLHYAADGRPGVGDPAVQRAIVEILVDAGAHPCALDKGGVAPIHRAVRTRAIGAVLGLLGRGADPHQPNKSGSTPLTLATSTTGKSGSASAEARAAAGQILAALAAAGAY